MCFFVWISESEMVVSFISLAALLFSSMVKLETVTPPSASDMSEVWDNTDVGGWYEASE